LPKPATGSGVGRYYRREDLERDRAVQMLIVGKIHDPHTTGAYTLDDAEVAEDLTEHRASAKGQHS
jgi:hypothetical protein